MNELKPFQEERVPFGEVEPILEFIEDNLDVHPTRVLHQSLARYASAELVTINKKIYDAALDLKMKLDKVLSSGMTFEKDKLREGVYGERQGLILFTEIEEELEFLNIFAGKSPKKYLGRSPSTYKKKRAKRIASWRAEKIKDDCEIFISENPHLPVSSIPSSSQRMRIKALISVLKARLNISIRNDLDPLYVKSILSPLHDRHYYNLRRDQFTSVDRTPNVLGMRKRAFDLMVSEHRDIINRIGMYDQKWYLPDLYLKELVEKEGFDLVKKKYELFAQDWSKSHYQV